MRSVLPATGVEFTHDLAFEARLRRLSIVSFAALGTITLLAWRDDAPAGALAMLSAGWVLMPVLLRASLRRPPLRYALSLPAGLVGVGLLWFAASGFPPDAEMGWWTITVSIWLGATLGSWLWYRWLPVPPSLRDPFGPERLALVALHVGGAVAGIVLVI